MFLAEPQKTPYDFRFQVFGFDVRVSPFFWLMAIVLGWDWARFWDEAFAASQFAGANPGQGMLLLIWVAIVFVSILGHELGHTFAMRHYGIRSHVVLYHFGGLAVPDSASAFMHTSRRSNPFQQIVISAAGPAVQLVISAILILLIKGQGYAISTGVGFVDDLLRLGEGTWMSSPALLAACEALLFVNLFWALMNLLPVYPLDGGQISRELFVLYGGGDAIRNSLILSIAIGAAAAFYGFNSGNMMLAIMFAMLAFSSYQILQAYSGRGGFGPW